MRSPRCHDHTVITIDVDATVIDAAERLSANQIASMPVLDADGRLIGMISELDIIRGRLAHDPRSHVRRDHHDMDDPATTVRSVMTPTAICLTEFADVADIAETMLDYAIRAVPIVDGPHVVASSAAGIWCEHSYARTRRSRRISRRG
jgi:CBS domain-containing protein